MHGTSTQFGTTELCTSGLSTIGLGTVLRSVILQGLVVAILALALLGGFGSAGLDSAGIGTDVLRIGGLTLLIHFYTAGLKLEINALFFSKVKKISRIRLMRNAFLSSNNKSLGSSLYFPFQVFTVKQCI